MKVNAWICTCANDSDLESATDIDHESGLSVKPTVILRVV